MSVSLCMAYVCMHLMITSTIYSCEHRVSGWWLANCYLPSYLPRASLVSGPQVLCVTSHHFKNKNIPIWYLLVGQLMCNREACVSTFILHCLSGLSIIKVFLYEEMDCSSPVVWFVVCETPCSLPQSRRLLFVFHIVTSTTCVRDCCNWAWPNQLSSNTPEALLRTGAIWSLVCWLTSRHANLLSCKNNGDMPWY